MPASEQATILTLKMKTTLTILTLGVMGALAQPIQTTIAPCESHEYEHKNTEQQKQAVETTTVNLDTNVDVYGKETKPTDVLVTPISGEGVEQDKIEKTNQNVNVDFVTKETFVPETLINLDEDEKKDFEKELAVETANGVDVSSNTVIGETYVPETPINVEQDENKNSVVDIVIKQTYVPEMLVKDDTYAPVDTSISADREFVDAYVDEITEDPMTENFEDLFDKMEGEVMETAEGFVPLPFPFRRRQQAKRRFATRRYYRRNPYMRRPYYYYPYFGYYHPSLRYY